MSTADEMHKTRKFLWPRLGSNGFKNLGNVVAFVVACGTFLMAISLLAGPDASREVLPFVTGLIGFLGGLVIAMYNVARNDTQSSGSVKDDKSVGMA